MTSGDQSSSGLGNIMEAFGIPDDEDLLLMETCSVKPIPCITPVQVSEASCKSASGSLQLHTAEDESKGASSKFMILGQKKTRTSPRRNARKKKCTCQEIDSGTPHRLNKQHKNASVRRDKYSKMQANLNPDKWESLLTDLVAVSSWDHRRPPEVSSACSLDKQVQGTKRKGPKKRGRPCKQRTPQDHLAPFKGVMTKEQYELLQMGLDEEQLQGLVNKLMELRRAKQAEEMVARRASLIVEQKTLGMAGQERKQKQQQKLHSTLDPSSEAHQDVQDALEAGHMCSEQSTTGLEMNSHKSHCSVSGSCKSKGNMFNEQEVNHIKKYLLKEARLQGRGRQCLKREMLTEERENGRRKDHENAKRWRKMKPAKDAADRTVTEEANHCATNARSKEAKMKNRERQRLKRAMQTEKEREEERRKNRERNRLRRMKLAEVRTNHAMQFLHSQVGHGHSLQRDRVIHESFDKSNGLQNSVNSMNICYQNPEYVRQMGTPDINFEGSMARNTFPRIHYGPSHEMKVNESMVHRDRVSMGEEQRERERERNRERQRLRRTKMMPEEKAAESLRRKIEQRRRRQDPEYRAKERARQRERMQNKRQLPWYRVHESTLTRLRRDAQLGRSNSDNAIIKLEEEGYSGDWDHEEAIYRAICVSLDSHDSEDDF